MEKKIKDTKLGVWLKEKAPNVFDAFKDAMPDDGVIGFIKSLVDDSKKDAEYYAATLEAEKTAQEAITARWLSDNSSDNKLAQYVRPVTLIVLLALYLTLVLADSIEAIAFEVKPQYTDLLEVLSMTAFGAYFAGRSYEKTRL